MNANLALNQRMRMALYVLKREYGAIIDIYQLADSATDVRIGVKTIVTNVFRVYKAIVLPAKIDSVAQKDISIISANKEFAFGGQYPSSTREFIVDRRDCPSLANLTDSDWVVFNNVKYQIKSVQAFEYDQGWILTTKALVGEIPQQTFSVRADNRIGLSDSVGQS